MTKKVLIVGGGFAGVKSALKLAQDNNFEVTLISNRTSLLYYPTLYRVATGGEPESAELEYSEIFKNHKIKLVQAEADKLDSQKKQIVTTDNQTFDYDKLIIALGVLTNYFNIPGLQEFSYGVKSVEEAEHLKAHIHEQILSDKKPDLNYVIVGAGPTGIEIAADLGEYIDYLLQLHNINHRHANISIVEASDRVTRTLPIDASKTIQKRLKKIGVKLYLNQAVQSLDDDQLTFNGKGLKSHTVIWTAGMSNHPFFANNGFNLSDNRKVEVDMYLQAKRDIYVLGDNANTPFSGLAETAVYDAEFVANNLIREVNNQKIKTYKPKEPITILPVGKNWAILAYKNLRIYGLLGFALRRFADAYAFHDYEPWQNVGKKWLMFYKREDICPICKSK